MGSKNRRKMPPEIADLVKRRSRDDCEIRVSPQCNGDGEQLHHRKMRSQGGPDLVVNLVHVCNACHRWVHRHVSAAYSRGYLVRSVHDPADRPLLLPTRFFGRRWHRLTEEGASSPTAAPLDYDPDDDVE